MLVLSCLGKPFTSILNNRLTKYLESHAALNENQAGFRQGYSTADHVFTLNALIELFKSRKKNLFCTFIDFSKAFDSVWCIGLWDKLLESSINGKYFVSYITCTKVLNLVYLLGMKTRLFSPANVELGREITSHQSSSHCI